MERACQEGHGRRRHRDAVHARRSRRVGARRRAEARHQHGRGLHKTLLAAKSIGYSRGCSGEHAAEGIAQLGLTEQLKPKVTAHRRRHGPGHVLPGARRLRDRHPADQHHGRRARHRLCRAGARLAWTSRARTASALLTVSKEQDAARAMIKFMTSPEGACRSCARCMNCRPELTRRGGCHVELVSRGRPRRRHRGRAAAGARRRTHHPGIARLDLRRARHGRRLRARERPQGDRPPGDAT